MERRTVGTVAALARAVGVTLRRHDIALYAAAASFYALIAVVPTLLLALRLSAWAVGPGLVVRLGNGVADALPGALGAPGVVRALVAASATMSPIATLAALVPALLYGEGLRRALDALAGHRARFSGWRGRLLALPMLAVAPLGALPVLAAGAELEVLFAGGAGRTLLAVYLAFLLDWVLVSLLLVWGYRVLPAAAPSWRATLWGAFGAGSFVAGFLQGFVLFLALPLDLGAPFGGFVPVGAGVAVALWLFVLHLIVLVGFAGTLQLSSLLAEGGMPRRTGYVAA